LLVRDTSSIGERIKSDNFTAHPERHDHSKIHAPSVQARSADKCARHIEQRRDSALLKRRNAMAKRSTSVKSSASPYKYTEIQNKTCLLAPDTIFGPYDVDGELHRHDVREGQEGIDLFLDLGLIDVETCEPLSDAWLTIWVSGPASIKTSDT
jgi:hypothetical protein